MIRFRNVQSVIFFTALVHGSETTFKVLSKRLAHHHYEAHLYAYSYQNSRWNPDVANKTYVDDHEAEAESQKRCWYVKQLTDLCQKYNISDEALVAAVNIAQRAFKQGYAIALNKSTDTTDKQPKADDRLTITEDEATAIDHMIYFHDMFKPDVLQVFRKVTKLQSQLAALVCTIQDLPLARLYESATAPEVSCQRLKRFNTTKSKKGELVVSA